MAALRIVYKSNGNKITRAFNHANPDTSATLVKTFAQSLIANKDIFAEEPDEIIGAEFYITQSVPVSLA